VTLAASPALAAATAWQDLAPGVRARLVSSDTIVDGKTLAGLELDMPPGTKTYWRIPGETGIPTEIDFSASSGVPSATILWPFPEIDRSQGYLDFVYHGQLVLPFELTLDGAATLSAAITMGICDEICVPASASFSLPLGTSPDAAQSLRLRQAIATTPIPWDHASVPFVDVRLDSNGTALLLIEPNPGIDPTRLIAEAGNPVRFFGTPQKSPQSAIWQLPLLGGADGTALVGQTVQLTFMTQTGPYSVTRDIQPARN
jgi:DsbC/DsbD-like thiol-disulfide interchange protein